MCKIWRISPVVHLNTLSLKRNTPWIHWLPLQARVKVKWSRAWSYLIMRTPSKKPIQKCQIVLPISLKVQMLCFGIRKTAQIPLQAIQIWHFSKWFVSFGQEYMTQLNCRVYFNAAVFRVLFCKRFRPRFHIKKLTWPTKFQRLVRVFCLLSQGAFPRWCMNPASLKYTLAKKKKKKKKKKRNATFLRYEILLLYMYSNILVLRENH